MKKDALLQQVVVLSVGKMVASKTKSTIKHTCQLQKTDLEIYKHAVRH